MYANWLRSRRSVCNPINLHICVYILLLVTNNLDIHHLHTHICRCTVEMLHQVYWHVKLQHIMLQQESIVQYHYSFMIWTTLKVIGSDKSDKIIQLSPSSEHVYAVHALKGPHPKIHLCRVCTVIYAYRAEISILRELICIESHPSSLDKFTYSRLTPFLIESLVWLPIWWILCRTPLPLFLTEPLAMCLWLYRLFQNKKLRNVLLRHQLSKWITVAKYLVSNRGRN